MLKNSIHQSSDGHIKGQFPFNAKASSSSKSSLPGNVAGISKGLNQKPIGPTVSVASSVPIKLILKKDSTTEKKVEEGRVTQPPMASSIDKSASLLKAIKNKKDSNLKESATNVMNLLRTKLNINSTTTINEVDINTKKSIVSILKKKLNINSTIINSDKSTIAIDEVDDSQESLNILSEKLSDLDMDTKTASSNGTGKWILAEAAGLSSVESIEKIILPSSAVSHNSLDGVISYQAPLISGRSTSPVKVASNQTNTIKVIDDQPNRSKKFSIDKVASMRMIRHELNIPNSVKSEKKHINDHHQDEMAIKGPKSVSLLNMLKSNKSKSPPDTSVTDQREEVVVDNIDIKAPIQPNQAIANLLLHKLKKSNNSNSNVPKSKPKDENIESPSELDNPTDPLSNKSEPLSKDDNATELKKKSSKNLSTLLSNAKKAMKSKQKEDTNVKKAEPIPEVIEDVIDKLDVVIEPQSEVVINNFKANTNVKKPAKSSLVPSKVIISKARDNKL